MEGAIPKLRNAADQQVEKLQEAVQSLCQIINPLGKCVDHLQEDAEAMNKEYQFWLKEYEMHKHKLETEKKITEEQLQVQLGQIVELDEKICSQCQRITSLKAEMLQNDDTICTLLRKISTKTISNDC